MHKVARSEHGTQRVHTVPRPGTQCAGVYRGDTVRCPLRARPRVPRAIDRCSTSLGKENSRKAHVILVGIYLGKPIVSPCLKAARPLLDSWRNSCLEHAASYRLSRMLDRAVTTL